MNAKQSTLTKTKVRPMEGRDIVAVYEIQRTLVGEERALIDTDLIAENMDGTLDLSFVAEIGSEVVGFIIARHTYIGEPIVQAGLIQGLGIHPLYQRRGLATSLVNALVETCRSKGIKTLRAMLSEQDSQTEGFFKKMQFHRAKLVIYDMSL